MAPGGRVQHRQRFEAALALAEQAGAFRCVAKTRLKVADHALMAGDVDDAIAVGRFVIEELRRLGQPAALGWALNNLCAGLGRAGDATGVDPRLGRGPGKSHRVDCDATG